ncbi:hypothetical protein SAMN06265795_106185 [Noviherbaspirillum humi]|uniref:Uncharacterized protein n=1 Tax=Noviherbaspirillum humi TaxID=1688639 RepID=A0A239HC14_9BURK|nr:hypothetical protein [Noviherbaspirillum humi]SNS78900.1 hypothetical protein SAMN06265795_106185 [Noviherbaspirillum humi]
MQELDCRVGPWHAHAQVREVDHGKMMAVISVTGEYDVAEQRHTVVYDHDDSIDAIEETRDLVEQLLQSKYGM